jgi:hypothetical protein
MQDATPIIAIRNAIPAAGYPSARCELSAVHRVRVMTQNDGRQPGDGQGARLS